MLPKEDLAGQGADSEQALHYPSTLEDDEFLIPLTDQRIFGAGLKRKRVLFVPESNSRIQPHGSNTTAQSAQAHTVRQSYLQVVLPDIDTQSRDKAKHEDHERRDVAGGDLCPDCGLPTEPQHSTSLLHLLSLPQSHPPSNLPRDAVGMRYLSSHGWDPDSRQGLGPQGEGRLYPVKAQEKHDRLGVGLEIPAHVKLEAQVKAGGKTARKPPGLTAKQMRQHEAESKSRGARLREDFYGNGELEKYLGEGA